MESSPTEPTANQLVPSVEYSQLPCVPALAALPTTARPESEAPESTSCNVTLLSVISWAIVRPAGATGSSATLASVRLPDNPGASFTGVTTRVAVIDLVVALTLSENAVVPPPLPGVTRDPAVPVLWSQAR